ncbi:choice-of-anchor I family protein [Arcobacteraceae bacterium]|nr:choice-of-anchor I family protein [Arcobacteraceae bacterium]
MNKYSSWFAVPLIAVVFSACSSSTNSLDNKMQKDVMGKLTKVGAYNTNKEGGSEISAFNVSSQKLYTTNGASNKIDILNLSDVNNPTLISSMDLSAYGSSIQSVTTSGNKVAVAVGSHKVKIKGKVVIFDLYGNFISQTTVGYLPDMVKFTKDGAKVIVANEGEPDASSGKFIDVRGSIGVVTVDQSTKDANNRGYKEVLFSNSDLTNANNGTKVRLGGTPSNSAKLDLEPEYITISGDNAYVTLQENNAIAKVDISGAMPKLTLVKSLGRKDYSVENTIDIEEEGEILMKNYPKLYSLYQPDSIDSYTVDGKTYLVTANEGDGREYCSDMDKECDTPVFIDEKKIKKLKLDSTIKSAYKKENDLKVMTDLGDIDNDGIYEELYTYGARSFSIWDENANLVFDSGDSISKIVAKLEPKLFNQDDKEIDGRSGNKGSEPEALTVGEIDGKTYAFVGLERQSAILVYDISNPKAPKFLEYYISHENGDLNPEGMVFVPSSKSPNGKNLLIVSYEGSGSTVVYEIN